MSKRTQLLPTAPALFLTLCFLGSFIPSVGSAQPATPITIIGRDYAFSAPDTVPAGATLFSLSNQGTVRHEAVILLLKEDHTLAEYLQAKTPEERRLSLGGETQNRPGRCR